MTTYTPPTVTLNTGAKLPSVGLGTWEAPPGQVENAVYHAIKSGYRHIDGAALYLNEKEVGEGIKKAISDGVVKREDIFVTTKLWIQDFHNIPGALDASLERLGLDYVDLYLMHWPVPLTPGSLSEASVDKSITFNDVWAGMEKLPKEKTRAIGISNFTIANVKKLLATAKVTPAVNQVELHVTLPQQKLVDFLFSGKYGFPEHDGKVIVPEAYSPLARGNLDNPVIAKIAAKYGVGPATVALSWNIARGVVVLPKSVTPARIESNFKIIKLTPEDIQEINDITKDGKNIKRECNFTDVVKGNPNLDAKDTDVFEGNADSL